MKIAATILACLATTPLNAQQAPQVPINCAIRPSSVIEIAAPMQGIIRQVHVRPGQMVKTGDVLAEFDADLLAAELALSEGRAQSTAARDAAKIRRDGLKSKLERLELARLRHAVSIAELDQAKLEFALAEGELIQQEDALRLAALDVARAKVALDKTRVLSPVDGVIGEDPIDPGESPNAKPIVTIYVVQPLRIEAYVPSALLKAFVDRGDFAVVVNQDANNPVTVTLDHVSQVVDLSSDTQSVFLNLDAPGILPGTKCQMLP